MQPIFREYTERGLVEALAARMEMPRRRAFNPLPHGHDDLKVYHCPNLPAALRLVIDLAVEIAREGREGRKVGTTFIVGDEAAVLARSRPLILDPLSGHPDASKRIETEDMRETVKELAQLDGAFVVSDSGVVVSAARYLEVIPENVDLPMGVGSRHLSAAGMTAVTRSLAVVVSESGTVRIFHRGKLVDEINPLLWTSSRERAPDPAPAEADVVPK